MTVPILPPIEEEIARVSRRLRQSGPAYLIAEAGVNHDGDLDVARELIEAAAEANADAVKFQTFRSEELVGEETPRAEYQARNTGSTASQREMLQSVELPYDAFTELRDHAQRCGVDFWSSPHTLSAVEALTPLVPAFKLGSGDVTNPLLLRAVAATGRPVVLGTGMSTLAEVERAVRWLKEAGAEFVIPLHCTSNYPCPDSEVHLDAMLTLANQLEIPVGYSDHTRGLQVPIMAATLGAVVIEKHFTLDRNRSGPDHAASLEPRELAELADALRRVPTIRGQAEKQPTAGETTLAATVRKGLVAARDLPAGHTVTADDLLARRPVGEIAAEDLDDVVGRALRNPVSAGTPLRTEDLR